MRHCLRTRYQTRVEHFQKLGVLPSAGGKELERSGELLSMQSYLSPGNVWFADLAEAL